MGTEKMAALVFIVFFRSQMHFGTRLTVKALITVNVWASLKKNSLISSYHNFRRCCRCYIETLLGIKIPQTIMKIKEIDCHIWRTVISVVVR